MRRGRSAAIVTAACIGLTLVPAAAAQAKRDYAVGSHTYTFVDKTRPTAANGTYAGAPTRTLSTLVLYPAKGAPGQPSVENARPLKTRHGFPLVVFSHGFGANGPAYRFLLERYVRQGYVVAAPTFPLSSAGAPGGSKLGDYVNQPADVSFVITRMLRLERSRYGYGHVVDRREIGVAGHSLGAITTLGLAQNSCCRDRRIDAAIAFSGIQLPFPGGTFDGRRGPPLMLVHGDKDGTVPYGGSTGAYDKARRPRVLLTLIGGSHVPFGAPYIDPTIRATTDFFDGYLKGDRRALRRLPGDGTVPGVASVRSDLGRY